MQGEVRPFPILDAPSCAYQIDASDLIVWVDDRWRDFAARNGAPAGVIEPVGRSLWDFIAGGAVRVLYAGLLGYVRSTRSTVHLPFRCDAPTLQRAMGLDLLPLDDGGVEFRSRIVLERPTRHLRLLDPRAPRSRDSVSICSMCKHVQEMGQWLEPRLSAWGAHPGPVPRLEETLCPACRELDRRVRSPSATATA